MATVRLRGIELGPGRPQICVPLVASSIDDLRSITGELTPDDFDLAELRIDHFDDVDEPAAVRAAITTVRAGLPDAAPLLFTFRSAPEGGARDIDGDEYEDLLRIAIDTGEIDAVDVEMFTELASLERLVNHARQRGVPVIMSSHDFKHTPTRQQIVARLRLQQDLGADVVKIAVMPESARDVLTLLEATEEYSRIPHARPAATMAMGPLGVVSRLAGETFGSCLTFGSIGRASAPGQPTAHELRAALELVHEAQSAQTVDGVARRHGEG